MWQSTEPVDVVLRDIVVDDLDVLFLQQCDPVAQTMAAFPGRDREAFMTHWQTRVLGNAAAINRVAVVEGEVAGHLVSYAQDDVQWLGYWFGRAYWGRGIATRALRLFLAQVPVRPLVAEVASHNIGSLRVLEKCGFIRTGSFVETRPDGTALTMLAMTLP